MEYTTRYVHKVATSSKDVGDNVSLDTRDLADRKTLGAALRKARILIKGGTVREYRAERDGRIVAFPTCPGLTTYWHSIILTPIGE